MQREFNIGTARRSRIRKPYHELSHSARWLRDNPDKARKVNEERRGAIDEHGNAILPGDPISNATRTRRVARLSRLGQAPQQPLKPIEQLGKRQKYWRTHPDKLAAWNARRREARLQKALQRQEAKRQAQADAAAAAQAHAAESGEARPEVELSELRPKLKKLKHAMLVSFTTKSNKRFDRPDVASARLHDYVAELEKELHAPTSPASPNVLNHLQSDSPSRAGHGEGPDSDLGLSTGQSSPHGSSP